MGDIREASGRHLGGVWEAPGSMGGIQEHLRASGSKVCSNTCVLSVKVAQSLKRRSVWKVEWHFDRFVAIT